MDEVCLAASPAAPDRTAEARDLLAALSRRPLPDLLDAAAALGRAGHGGVVGYSRKVFIPLTRLCRDACGYCTFARGPREVARPYLLPEEVLAIARAGQAAGCREALFTLGDKPELRYAAARAALRELGFGSTTEYLAHLCALVLRETGLLPHVNAGVMPEAEIAALRRVSVSQGLMLENVSPRLGERGGPHHGAPDKDPALRLAMLEAAGRLAVPFTSGILIGIGETRLERLESLLALRDLHARHGHLQEVIVQNFRAKPGTRMAASEEPEFDELLWTAAAARLVLGPAMNIQVPPNLSFSAFPRLLAAGINDWGGISPVTADHVNPDAPWPQIPALRAATEAAGYALAARLAIHPAFAAAPERWLDPALRPRVLAAQDAAGFAREDAWLTGELAPPPPALPARRPATLDRLLHRAMDGERLDAAAIARLFAARGGEVTAIAEAADALRRRESGEVVRYVVTRNVNYTNVCTLSCRFCAFSKGRTHENLRGRPYDLALEEVSRRAAEAWERGATEICMQGGINPGYTGETYLALLRAVKRAAPGLHVHAFSPLEVSQGAATLGIGVADFLERLREAGLGSLPGTAAEILHDEVRARIAPGKLDTAGWLGVVETAHRLGLRSTATIMFGHVERPAHWAAHLLHLRDLQARNAAAGHAGFTEFVPLPFVHMEAPMFLRGESRMGPSWREALLMHAVARLVLHPLIPNIQASWVKLGPEGVARVLAAGVNDLGGTLMDESISRAAGTRHGQEFPPEAMEALIRAAGRVPAQRTTLYGAVPEERRQRSRAAAPLAPRVQTPWRGKRRVEA
ncbi:5-amino-6-(D-ribitylamino)uracil--L-tyrosine 4-hydroxyphenyl transferase CofH [Roseomonas sp. NAR14]|uniref:FO synthase n=1 Tax=Roseomonas acroporae TaxID=2937791 RepID=A0A9X1Y9M9_9PROT|nr:5-amino-6-(D-ribitylamino)uracil--L-tyrosine 4-hydroxyphenyl transferase CofH [Roseomonas acroporae]MCK8785677.1 5-amino-6-(D-ribitylamino)uracil--L-tyrosine 4-hydroxyphenyl transferase CofH [Roseomonas acroporae]